MRDPHSEVLRKLDALGKPGTFEYGRAARELADSLREEADRELLARTLEDARAAPKRRLAAFYVLLIRLFRDEDYAGYQELYRTYRADFAEYLPELGLEAEYELTQGNQRHTLRRALKRAEEAIQAAPENPYVLHAFGHIAARLAEHFVLDDDTIAHALDTVEAAIRHVERQQRPQAIFYATRAQLLALQGKHEEAHASLDQAIATEPYGSPHYSQRMANFHAVRVSITLREHLNRLESAQASVMADLESMRSEVEEARNHLVGLLALLAAVIAFIVTGTQLATTLELKQAARLMIISTGALIVLMTAFSALFGSRTWSLARTMVTAVCFALGAAMLGPPLLF